MVTFSARSEAEPRAAWQLMARPSRWHEWAPHIRGAWGLGEPEVRVGAVGVVRVLGGLVPVPARIVSKRAGRMWSWRVGPVVLAHRVEPRDEGCVVAIDLEAPGPLEPALAATYGRVIGPLVERLARKAAESG